MKSTIKSSRAGKILSILAMLALVFSFLPTAALSQAFADGEGGGFGGGMGDYGTTAGEEGQVRINYAEYYTNSDGATRTPLATDPEYEVVAVGSATSGSTAIQPAAVFGESYFWGWYSSQAGLVSANTTRVSTELTFNPCPEGATADLDGKTYTAIWSSTPRPADPITIPVSKRINASEATPTEGITYTFDFVADAADEAGEYDVPAGVDIPTITLTAAAMSGSTQDLSDTAGLPEASAFGHAGKYTFKVSEVSSATTNWTNDSTEYEINVFVVNDGNGGLKYDDTTPFAIKVNGEKTDACAFVNTYNAVSDLSITKNTVGEFADLTAAFPFSITVNIPEWSDVSTVNYTVAPGNGSTASISDEATVSNHSFTITTSLSNSGNVHITGLPVGSTYSVSETNSNHENSNGDVNVYVPTATYKYSSTSEAAGFTTNTNNVAAGEGSLTVAASGATANVSTMIGDGDDNSVVFTNTLDNPPLATGLAGMGALPYIALIAALAGVAVVFLRARGRRDQEEK